MSVAAFYLSPHGRLSRQGYWLFSFIPFTALGVVLGPVTDDLYWPPFTNDLRDITGSAWLVPTVSPLDLTISLILLYPATTPLIRRLHDFGMTGWVLVLMIPLYIYPYTMVGAVLGHSAIGSIAFILLSILALIISVLAFFKKGDAEANRFGGPPEPFLILVKD